MSSDDDYPKPLYMRQHEERYRKSVTTSDAGTEPASEQEQLPFVAPVDQPSPEAPFSP